MLLKKSLVVLLLATTLLPSVSTANEQLELFQKNRVQINQCIQVYKLTEIIEDALMAKIDKQLVIKEFEQVPNIDPKDLAFIKNLIEFTYNTKKVGMGQLMLRECLNGRKTIIV